MEKGGRNICLTLWKQCSLSIRTLLGGQLMSKKLNPSSKPDLSSAAASSTLVPSPLHQGLLRDQCQYSNKRGRLELRYWKLIVDYDLIWSRGCSTSTMWV